MTPESELELGPAQGKQQSDIACTQFKTVSRWSRIWMLVVTMVECTKARRTESLDSATDGERPLEAANFDQAASNERAWRGSEGARHVDDCARDGRSKLESVVIGTHKLPTTEQPRAGFRRNHRGQQRSLKKYVC